MPRPPRTHSRGPIASTRRIAPALLALALLGLGLIAPGAAAADSPPTATTPAAPVAVPVAPAVRAGSAPTALASTAAIPPPDPTTWQLNGPDTAIQADGSLLLSTGSEGRGGSAFYKLPVAVTGVTTVSFDVTLSEGMGASNADGVTVALLDAATQSPTAIGEGVSRFVPVRSSA